MVEIRVATGLLGGHVVRRADDHAGLGQLRAGHADLGDAEIEHLDEVGISLALDEEDVLRLHVAVDDPFVVSRRQRPADLGEDVHRARNRQDLDLVEQGAHLLAVEELHDDVRGAIVHLVHVGHAEDVGVLELRGGDRLAPEPLQSLGIAREVRVQRLDREALAQGDVAAEVDLPHAAFADLLLDAVLPADDEVEERILLGSADDQQLRGVRDAELHRIIVLSVALRTNPHARLPLAVHHDPSPKPGQTDRATLGRAAHGRYSYE